MSTTAAVKILHEPLDDDEDDEELFLMTNLAQATTGLPMIVWVSVRSGSHGPRLKVQKDYSTRVNPDNMLSVSISERPQVLVGGKLSPKDLSLVSRFIELNKKVLLDYWNCEFTTESLFRLIVPVE